MSMQFNASLPEVKVDSLVWGYVLCMIPFSDIKRSKSKRRKETGTRNQIYVFDILLHYILFSLVYIKYSVIIYGPLSILFFPRRAELRVKYLYAKKTTGFSLGVVMTFSLSRWSCDRIWMGKSWHRRKIEMRKAGFQYIPSRNFLVYFCWAVL